GEVEQVVEVYRRLDGKPLLDGVPPPKVEVKRSQPTEVNMVTRGCRKGGGDSTQPLKLRQSHQVVGNYYLDGWRRLVPKPAVVIDDKRVDLRSASTPIEMSEVRSGHRIS